MARFDWLRRKATEPKVGFAPANSFPSRWPSVDLIYQEVTSQLQRQYEEISALDSKANFGLGSATLLTAGVSGLSAISNRTSNPIMTDQEAKTIALWEFGTVAAETVSDWLIAVSLGVYLAVVVFSYLAYRAHNWNFAPDPSELLRDAVAWEPDRTMAQLAVQRAKDFAENKCRVETKAKWVRFLHWAILAEAVVLLLSAALQAWI